MYPLPLLSQHLDIFPLFGENTTTPPASLDYSVPEFLVIDPRNMESMEEYNRSLLNNSWATWAIWGYLEDRSHILTGTHIREEGRIYHLGIDILFEAKTKLYNPLDGRVYESWYEPWDGNYGWYIIIEYILDTMKFYALYGHLSLDSITKNTFVKRWEYLATLGAPEENGNWFPHLHLQVFTGQDLDTWKNRWYCSEKDLSSIRNFCPDPSFLFRYG